jgi:hypothetical protein
MFTTPIGTRTAVLSALAAMVIPHTGMRTITGTDMDMGTDMATRRPVSEAPSPSG